LEVRLVRGSGLRSNAYLEWDEVVAADLEFNSSQQIRESGRFATERAVSRIE